VAAGAELPRIEDFRTDLTADEIVTAEGRNVRSIAMQAYLQAFPAFLHFRQLTEFVQGRAYMAPGEFPLGGWFLMRELATPATTTVSPNVDTLYGATYVLLNRQGPVVLRVPSIPDRYWSVAFADAYFNVFEIVGTRTFGGEAGEFLLVPPGWRGQPPAGIRDVIEAPTPSVCLLQRIYTRGAAEFERLHRLQDEIRLVPLGRLRSPDESFPPVDIADLAVPAVRMTRDSIEYFRLMNAYTGWNPPPTSDAGLVGLFRSAGVGPGSTVPEDPAVQSAIRVGSADAQSLINARLSAGQVRDGWRVPDPVSGLAGPHIAARASIQATQMGIFPLEEAMYFFAYRDGSGGLLDGRRPYTLTFPADQLPPLHKHGFWSLTMYGADSLLVANPIDRYVIRPDSPRLTMADDGSLTLYLGAERPDGAPDGNWLPAPNGPFNVALRTYLPKPAIVDGGWFPPGIREG
jgi:hypothetical protein